LPKFSGSATAILIALLVALSMVVTLDTAASAASPGVTVKDKGGPRSVNAIEAFGQAGVAAEFPLAKVTVTLDRDFTYNDWFTVWLDLDKDPRPDLRIDGMIGSEYVVRKVNGWSLKGKEAERYYRCVSLSGEAGVSSADVTFDPDCLGKTKTFRFSAKVSTSDGDRVTGVDYVGKRHHWSKRVRSYV
jgi:hypothetical protein